MGVTSEESDIMKLLLVLVLATVAMGHPAENPEAPEPSKYVDILAETSGSRRNKPEVEVEVFNKNKFRSARNLDDRKKFGGIPDTPRRRPIPVPVSGPRAARSGPGI